MFATVKSTVQSLGVLLCVLALAANLPADVVILKNGDRIEGKIRDALSTDAQLVVTEQVVGGTRTHLIKREEIRRIERGDAAEDAFGAGEAAPSERKPGEVAPSACVVGYVGCPGARAGSQSPPGLADATAQGLRDAVAAGDQVIVLHLDGALFTPAETLEILAAINDALTQGMADRLVAYVSDASGGSALLALACPNIVCAPGAVLRSPTPSALAGQDGASLIRLMKSISPERSSLIDAFCSGAPLVYTDTRGWSSERDVIRILPVRGVLAVNDQLAISSGLARGTAKSLEAVHLSLGRGGEHVYQDRTVGAQRVQPTRPPAVDDKVLFQIDRQVARLNDGLAEAVEGIAIFLGPGRSGLRNRSGTLFDRVKNSWSGGDNDRVSVREEDVENSKKAQGLIKDGLKDVEDAAAKLGRYLRQGYTDPRLAKAVAYAEAVKPLYYALRRDRNPNDFKAKCQAVVDCDPL